MEEVIKEIISPSKGDKVQVIDGRTWVANSLREFIEGWYKGDISV